MAPDLRRTERRFAANPGSAKLLLATNSLRRQGINFVGTAFSSRTGIGKSLARRANVDPGRLCVEASRSSLDRENRAGGGFVSLAGAVSSSFLPRDSAMPSALPRTITARGLRFLAHVHPSTSVDVSSRWQLSFPRDSDAPSGPHKARVGDLLVEPEDLAQHGRLSPISRMIKDVISMI